MKKKIGILLLSVMLVASSILSGCTGNKDVKSNEPETSVSKQVESTTEESKRSEVRAQDDFYDHVNSKIIEEKKAEGQGESWDQFSQLSEQVKDQLTKIAEEIAKDHGKHEAGSAEKALSDLFHTAKDKASREKVGLSSLASYVKDIENADSIQTFLEAMAKVRKELGKSSLLSFITRPNPKDASQYSLFLEEPNLLLEKMDFEQEEMREVLKNYMKELLIAYGNDDKQAEESANRLSAFYQELAKAAYTKKESNNVKNTLNIVSLEELKEKLSNMDVAKFLKDSGQGEFSSWVVENPKMLSLINKYLVQENLELLKQYSVVSLLHEYAPYLNESFVKAHATFNQQEAMEDKEQAWDATKTLAEQEVGEIYAKKFFSTAKKEEVTKLVKEILAAYRKNIESLDWLSEASRKEAIKKIESMMVKIGYPDQYQSFVKGHVKSPEEGGNLIDNAIAISKARALADLSKATAKVDRSEWELSPQSINAFYEPSLNEIVFPAAMLQAPFFDEKASRAQNLGGIGAIIAHEITHAFDDMGSLYDDKGNYRDWWTKEDRLAFAERTKKFVSYFGGIEVLPGQKLDGELTLGENIADSGSISVISSMLGDDPAALQEMFKNYAKIWASIADEEELAGQLQSDEHAPAKVRVNGVLSTTDAFYKAFDIKPGDKMYVAPENRAKLF